MENSTASCLKPNSVHDESRIADSFQPRNPNNDGFVNSSVYKEFCRQMDLRAGLNDIMKELEDDDRRKMSYDDFLKTHLNVEQEIEAFSNDSKSYKYLPNVSNNNIGNRESWNCDNDLQDLSSTEKKLPKHFIKDCNSSSLGSSANLAQSFLIEIEETSNLTPCFEEQVTDPLSTADLSINLDMEETLKAEEEKIATGAPNFLSGEPVPCNLNDNDTNNDSPLKTKIIELEDELKLKNEQIKKLQMLVVAFCCVSEKSKIQSKPENFFKANQPCSNDQTPVLKTAERIKLKTMEKQKTGYHVSNLDVTRTEVAEHLVSDLTENCNIQELKEKHELEVETERLHTKLDHAKAQNSLLQFNFEETKLQCDRLSILIGKYESNIVGLKQALDKNEEIVEVYSSLLSLIKKNVPCSVSQEEKLLIGKLKKLIKERHLIKSTVVKLESHIVEPVMKQPVSTAEARKLDIETAVLMQELMALREEKAELKAQLFYLEKEKEELELKFFSQQMQFFALLKSQCGVDSSLLGSRINDSNSEVRLREHLKEIALTLEQVTRNAETRQRSSNQQISQLKIFNAALSQNLEKCKQKSQTRLRKIETQMLSMAERYALQVSNLKHSITSLENKVLQYEDSISMLQDELRVLKKPCN